ncbi:hypothetical protein HK102_007675 [Quaeritorhiza haematococci]|nr:hypothetical protein HK102_007675 [Quaeritorhiza haematococci]
MLFLNRRLTSPQLHAHGLITSILPPENFLPQVLAIARRAASLSESAVKATKGLIRSKEVVGGLVGGLREYGRISEMGVPGGVLRN